MKKADLYIRVSTDEQADKGYSQRNQEETLRRFCEINRIEVRKVIYEDHSAKTFNRPEWQKLLSELKKHRGKSDLVLFTKWDRFSRNAGDAYQMINTLRKLGVEPQAVEQPLDLSIPENKMMLAIYVAAPEVENDRRALNVFHGMRRAKKEGRWMATAPIGYVNKTNENGRKYIEPKEPEASIFRWAFAEIAKGQFNTEQIFKEAKKKGLGCVRSNFWFSLRNPVYCGKIRIPKFKDEEEYLVDGQHEPIISEALFYQVQDVLDGRARVYKPKVVANATLPLRGFLICPNCNRILTGSASKGRTLYYSYYHCSGGCPSRFKAEEVNDQFVDELRKYVPNAAAVETFKKCVSVAYKDQSKIQQDDKKQLLTQLKEQQDRLAKARELLLTGDIDPADYKIIKTENERKITILEAKLAEFSGQSDSVMGYINDALNNLSNLDNLFTTGTIERKRNIVGSMFPEKMIFDGSALRTNRVNDLARRIYNVGAGLSEKKDWTSGNNSNLSSLVASTGIEPVSKV